MSEPTRDRLVAEIEALRSRITCLVGENEVLRVENASLAGTVERLTRRVDELTHRLDKGSKNSSMPPSSDSIEHKAEASKTRAQRRAEAKAKRKGDVQRNRGKQPGAPGTNLSMRPDPDDTVEHPPTHCGSCGDDLAGAPIEATERRQVFDFDKPVLVCVEHRALTKRCRCGATTKGAFPASAKAPASYGPNVRSSALYLLMGQHLPVERTAQAMASLLGCSVSTGFIASLAPEAADGLVGFLDELKARLRDSDLLHVDETFDHVGTNKMWFHVAANELHTFLVASMTRAKSAPDDAGVLGEFSGTMVHDRLSMYFKYDQATHAICHAHIQRDLAAVGIIEGQGWANDMATLLLEMNNAAHSARDKGKSRLSRRLLAAFLARYDKLSADGLAANPQPQGRTRDRLEADGYNLAAALTKLRPEATRFVTDLSVPFTNNEAERSVRMVKLHSKVSGCFQSLDGAKAFAAVRSYLDTARKHEIDALDVLAMLFGGDAWMPPRTT
ncbi:MAG: IS66 family transposase [Acidimicrobiales bacterium]